MRKRPARTSKKPRTRRSISRSTAARRAGTVRRIRRSKTVKNMIRVVIFILVVGISALFILGLGIYRNLTKNFASADSPNSYNVSDQEMFSVLYISVNDIDESPVIVKDLSMVFFDKQNKKLVRYLISPNILMDIPGKFGEEPLFNVFALGALNSANEIEGGIVLMDKSISKLFGYKVDKYLLLDSTLEESFEKFLRTGNLSTKYGPAETNLTFSEFYGIVKFINSLPSDRIIEKTIGQEFADKPELLDDEIRDITFDSILAEERKSISVLNGAQLPGLASMASRYIENMGGRVVSVGNADRIYETSMLIVDDPTSETVKKIVHTYGFTHIVKKNEVELLESEISRSDIVLLFGLDSESLL